MKHFTISAKGKRTHTFKESGFMYSLETMNDEGRIEEYFIYADNRKAACEKGKIIVSAHDINAEVKRQNGLQQIHRAELLRKTGEYTDEQINEFIERIKAHYGIVEAEKQEGNKHMNSLYTEFQSFKAAINDVTYVVDMMRVNNKNYNNSYECTVYLINDEEETVRTIDRFKLVYNSKEGYYWAWTGNLMAGVHLEKINIREAIAETLNRHIQEKNTKIVTAEQNNNNTYTAYNRTFSTYEEAVNYCNESDFDPSHTETVNTSTVSDSENFYHYNQTFDTYRDAFNYVIKNNFKEHMILYSLSNMDNNRLMELESLYVYSKYKMSYEDAKEFYHHLKTIPETYNTLERLNSLRSIIERHEYHINNEANRQADMMQAINQQQELLDKMFSLGYD